MPIGGAFLGTVSGARVHTQRWKAARWVKLDFDFSPFPISRSVTWVIANDVLIPQLKTDLFGYVRKLVNVVHAESAATTQVCQAVQERRALALFHSWAYTKRLVYADRVKLNV